MYRVTFLSLLLFLTASRSVSWKNSFIIIVLKSSNMFHSSWMNLAEEGTSNNFYIFPMERTLPSSCNMNGLNMSSGLSSSLFGHDIVTL